jgi:hypothetical protein
MAVSFLSYNQKPGLCAFQLIMYFPKVGSRSQPLPTFTGKS